MSDEISPPRWGRRIASLAAFILAGLVVFAAAAWIGRASVAEYAIAAFLRAEGLPPAVMNVAEIGLDGARITDLRFGADRVLDIEEVTARYTITGFASGRIEKLVVSGARLKITVGAAGASFGSFDSLLAGGGPSNDGATPSFPPIELRDSRIIAETPFGPFALAANGSVRPTANQGLQIATDIAIATPLGPLAGRLVAQRGQHGRIVGGFGLAEGALAWQTVMGEGMTGWIAFDGGGGKPPKIAGQIQAQRLTLADARFDEPSFTLDLTGNRFRASTHLRATGGGAGLDLSADADLTTAPMVIQAEGTAHGTSDSEPWRIWNLPPLTDGTAEFALTLSGSPAALEGGFTARLAAKDATVGEIALTQPKAALNGTLSLLGGALTVRAAQGSTLGANSVRPTTDLVITGPLEFALESGAGPLLELGLGDPKQMPIRFDFRLGPSPFSAKIVGVAENDLTLDGRTPQLAIVGVGDAADATLETEIVAEDGSAKLPAYGLRFDGLGALVRYAQPPLASGRLANFHADRVLVDGKPRPVVPLNLDGSVDQVGGSLTFTARLRDQLKRIALQIDGTHDPAAGSGEARLSLAPLAFAPGALQPGDLFPAIGKTIAEAAGRVAATGSARWSESGRRARASVPIQDLSLTLEGVKFEGMSGKLNFDSGAVAPPEQTLTIARLDLGLPLRDGRVRFRITPKLVFEVAEMNWTLAGGHLFARDLTIDPFAEKRGIVLEAKDIDIGQILSHAEAETVSATGRLEGRVPIEIVGGQVAIRDGLLETAAPGVIRYKHNVSAEEVRKSRPEIALMIQALENFHYERVGMTINQEPGGEALIALQIRGKNPDLMKGKPFVLNLNFSGNLVEIVGCFAEGYCSAKEIGQMILQFFE